MESQQWNSLTFIFYVFIIGNCAGLAKILSGLKWKNGSFSKVKKADIAIPLMILILVKGLSVCGRDVVGGYKLNFYSAASMSEFRDQSIEFGYRLMNVLVYKLTGNYTVFLLLAAMMTIVPVWHVFSKYRNQIDIPIAIMAYSAVFFYQSLSLMRIYIAASLCLLSFDALFEKKYQKAVMWVLAASLFHITAIVMMIPCLYCIFRVNRKLFLFALIAANILLFAEREQLSALFTGRYYVYRISESFNFGTEFIWFYGPFAVLYWYINRIRKKQRIQSNTQTRLIDISFIWVLMGIFFSIAQYVVNIFGRLIVYTLPITLFLAASLDFVKRYKRRNYKWIYGLSVIYLLLRFCIYITGYYNSDGIMPYMNCFGLEI